MLNFQEKICKHQRLITWNLPFYLNEEGFWMILKYQSLIALHVLYVDHVMHILKFTGQVNVVVLWNGINISNRLGKIMFSFDMNNHFS